NLTYLPYAKDYVCEAVNNSFMKGSWQRGKLLDELYSKLQKTPLKLEESSEKKYLYGKQLEYFKQIVDSKGQVDPLTAYRNFAGDKKRLEEKRPVLLDEVNKAEEEFKAANGEYYRLMSTLSKPASPAEQEKLREEIAKCFKETVAPAYEKQAMARIALSK